MNLRYHLGNLQQEIEVRDESYQEHFMKWQDIKNIKSFYKSDKEVI